MERYGAQLVLCLATAFITISALASTWPESNIVAKPSSQFVDPPLFKKGIDALDERNYSVAAEIFTTLSADNHAKSQFNLGYMYYEGMGVARDWNKGLFYTIESAKQGLPSAIHALAVAYRDGKGVDKNASLSAKFWQALADIEYPAGLYEIGRYYGEGIGVEADPEKSHSYILKAAEAGFPNAQHSIGNKFYFARSDKKNAQVARYWWAKAAAQGFSESQASLGVLYYHGEGVDQDLERALVLFSESAAQGNIQAQTILGVMYALGQGVPIDYTEAYKWWHQAALNGDLQAKANLSKLEGMMSATQRTQGLKLAEEWVPSGDQIIANAKKASSKGRKYYDVGRTFAMAQGASRDLTRAYMWWHIAAKEGNEDAKRGLKIIEEQMSPEQISSALQMASNCQKQNMEGC